MEGDMDLFGRKKPEVLFQELLEWYKVTIHRYYDATRRDCVSERGSTVAFELADIFKTAREHLPDDPDNAVSIDKFEKACDDIRARCFAQEDLSDTIC
jgi:hypothetical protein